VFRVLARADNHGSVTAMFGTMSGIESWLTAGV
jgi:hypothetical protein